jgi:hypothetical protein
VEYTNQIPFFLEQFLSRPASALPKGAQWVLQFDAGNGAIVPVEAIKKCIKYEPGGWEIEEGMNLVLDKNYHETKGCLFAQAVQIPGESMVANPEGLQTNGFIRGFVGGGRDTFPSLQVTFIETNISFVDNVIRPWIIATSHLGLIARSGEDNYRGTINVFKLGVIDSFKPPIVTQKYIFWGACPISITGEEYNYSPSNSPINRETTFTYHYYSVHSPKNFENYPRPLPLSTNERGVNVNQRTPIVGDIKINPTIVNTA